MTRTVVADGIPTRLLTDAETERIISAASGCVDWPAALNRTYFAGAQLRPAEPPACLAEVSQSEQFARGAARLMLLDSTNPLRALIDLISEGCFVEMVRVQTVHDLAAQGISAESAHCVAERTVETLLVAADSPDALNPDSDEGNLLMGMMFATLGCYSEEELERLMGEP